MCFDSLCPVVGLTENCLARCGDGLLIAWRLEQNVHLRQSPIEKNDPQRASCVVVGILHRALFFRVLEYSEAFFGFGTTFARDMSFIQRR